MRAIRGLRWWIIGLVMLGAVLNYMTRSAMGYAAPPMLRELHIGEAQYGIMTAVFQAGIMLQPAVGWIIDAVGLRIGFALFAGLWSLAAMAQALAGGVPAFGALRGVMGFAEGSSHPAGMKTVSTWFPAKERGFAAGIYNIGASFGAIAAAPLVAWATHAWSWRAAFVVSGLIGLVWAAVWFAVVRTPQRHPALAPGERLYIEDGQEPFVEGGPRLPAWRLLAQRNLWGIALPRLLADPTWGTLSFWIPLYLATARGFDLRQIALFAWLPFVAADLGCLFGPAVAAGLRRAGVNLIDARRGAFTLGALLMTGMVFVGRVESPYAAIALLCLGGFAHQTLSVTVIAMAADLFPEREVGTVAGVAGTCGNAGVLVFSLLIGALVRSVGYEPFFVALGALDLVGAAILWTLVRRPPPTPAAS